jgi:hypothetical protein
VIGRGENSSASFYWEGFQIHQRIRRAITGVAMAVALRWPDAKSVEEISVVLAYETMG